MQSDLRSIEVKLAAPDVSDWMLDPRGAEECYRVASSSSSSAARTQSVCAACWPPMQQTDRRGALGGGADDEGGTAAAAVCPKCNHNPWFQATNFRFEITSQPAACVKFIIVTREEMRARGKQKDSVKWMALIWSCYLSPDVSARLLQLKHWSLIAQPEDTIGRLRCDNQNHIVLFLNLC